MNVGGGGGTDGAAAESSSAVSHLIFTMNQRFQHVLDKSTPQVLYRWVFFAVIAFIYAIRVYLVEGYYIITYGLGIYILQLLIAFLSPQVDPEFQALADDDGPSLPTLGSDEFRPFVRRLPEFKFWYPRALLFVIPESRFDFYSWDLCFLVRCEVLVIETNAILDLLFNT